MQIDQYIDLAMQRQGIDRVKDLAELIPCHPEYIANYRANQRRPTEQEMLGIAALAGVPPIKGGAIWKS